MNITQEGEETKQSIIDILVKKNGLEYNLLKASEELQELSLILTQRLSKPKKVDEQDIIDEIGDVQIRLDILKKIFNNEKIENRIAYKLKKFNEYIQQDKYKQI